MNEYAKITLILFVVGFLVLVALLWTQVLIPIDMSVPSVIDRAVDERLLKTNWSKASAVPGDRGQCHFYETLSTETALVDSLTPIPIADLPKEFQCNDGFSMMLSKTSHVCNGDRCPGVNGLMYSEGDEEEYYTVCGTADSCPNSRSGVIFGFDLDDNNNLVDSAKCLSFIESEGEETKWTTSQCFPENYFTTNVFSSIDQIDVGTGSRVRIREPLTDTCMVVDRNNSIANVKCSEQATVGFDWLINREICWWIFETTHVPGREPGTVRDICTPTILHCIPPQLTNVPNDVEWPPVPVLDGDEFDCVNLENRLKYAFKIQFLLRSYRTLAVDEDDKLYLRSLSICNNNFPCTVQTAIVSALLWNEL